uniref:Dehydrogenase/reductase (SDR family) member 7Ca n=1 Tax=Myripristis murdjan TaxID=586833 RepID=A0A667ZDK0_9TELE
HGPSEMDPAVTTTVLLVPCVVVITAGLFYLYGMVVGLLSKTSVRNKVVVITDALSGLGKECASVFHKGGARLILCGKSWEKLEGLADDLASASDPTKVSTPPLKKKDHSDSCSESVIAEILECYGCLDILILNTAWFYRICFVLVLRNMLYVSVSGVLPSMISRRTGHLLLVNSIQGKLTVPFRTTYAASKHAVQAFFDCLRAEVEEYGISVSTISHTFISSSARVSGDFTYKCGLAYEAVAEIVKTLSNKRKEVVIAPSLPKVAIYARSFFPNVFFAVMAAGVKNAAAFEKM